MIYRIFFIFSDKLNKILIFLNLPKILAFYFLIFNFRLFLKRKKKKIIINMKALTTINETDLYDNYNDNYLFVPLSLRVAKDVYNKFYFPKDKFWIFKKKKTKPEGLKSYNKRIPLGNYNYWINIKKYKKEKLEIISFWESYFKILKYFKFCDFVVSTNYTYCYLYDINDVLKKLNIKSISFCKETIHSFAYQQKVINDFYKKTKFNGDKIIFYSKKQKKLYSSLNGINSTNSYYIGSPKTDKIVNFKKKKKNVFESVLFFSAHEDKFNGIPSKIIKKYKVSQKLNKFYLQYFDICNEFKNKDFALKLKRNNHIDMYLKPFLKKNKIKLPSNLKVLDEKTDPHYLIRNSKKIFVYHSTIILESLLLNKQIIEPEIYKNKTQDCKYFFTFGYEKAVTRVSNLNSVKNLYSKKKYYPKIKIQKKILNDYYGPVDGNTRKRFFQILKNI